MKHFSAPPAIALACLCVSAVMLPAAAIGAAPSVAVLTVSTTADAVNGDVSSPAALIARPGPDGISLREAIMAADKAMGRVGITFAPSLAGQTITPTTYLPAFTRADTALVGLTADGQPGVTIDAGQQPKSCCRGLLAVFASNVTVSHLRIIGVHGDEIGIAVRAGERGGALALHDVRIESNILDGGGHFGDGLWVGTDFVGSTVGASVTNVTVAHNLIRGFTDDGLNVGLPGTNCSITGLTVEDNTFASNTGMGSPALELDPNFSNNSISGTEILRNSFTDNWAGIHLNGGVGGTNNGNGSPIPAVGNVVSGTVIAQNIFDGNQQAIGLNGGASSNATGNSVLDTKISDDVFTRNAPFGAIGILGGGQGASGNRVEGVVIVNDTLAFNEGAVSIVDNGGGGSSGNQISSVVAQNSIFWSNGRDVGGPDASSATPTIYSSLMEVDPRFVSAQDLHLQPGSPAINAGTSDGAPAVDFEDRARGAVPDIGAYEFDAAPRLRLEVLLEELGGTGTVTSTPAGIGCETTCESAFDAHTAVALTATPAAGSRFAGWSGACSGAVACTVTLDTAATVSATFAPLAATPAPKLAPKCKKGQKSTAKHRCQHV